VEVPATAGGLQASPRQAPEPSREGNQPHISPLGILVGAGTNASRRRAAINAAIGIFENCSAEIQQTFTISPNVTENLICSTLPMRVSRAPNSIPGGADGSNELDEVAQLDKLLARYNKSLSWVFAEFLSAIIKPCHATTLRLTTCSKLKLLAPQIGSGWGHEGF
jgi:hypothetical protein